METKFNFNSQVCTSRFQSERLLALGLKKETADCYLFEYEKGKYKVIVEPWEDLIADEKYYSQYKDVCFPAWSLGRLIEMLPGLIYPKEELPSFSGYAYLNLTQIVVWYNYIDYDMEDRTLISWRGNGIFSAVVDAIEWLIKEGYFNKEYLV